MTRQALRRLLFVFVPLMVLLLGFSGACEIFGQDDKQSTIVRRKHSPLMAELLKSSKSREVSVAVAAIHSLQEFERCRSGRIAREARMALEELADEAKAWARPFQHKTFKDSLTFTKVELKNSDLALLQILRPKSLAFLSMERLDDYEIAALDQLDSLENLVLENCKLCEGFGFLDVRMDNLKLLHLNGTSIDDFHLKYLRRKNLPNLAFVNLTNTDVTNEAVEKFKARMEAGGTKLQVRIK